MVGVVIGVVVVEDVVETVVVGRIEVVEEVGVFVTVVEMLVGPLGPPTPPIGFITSAVAVENDCGGA